MNKFVLILFCLFSSVAWADSSTPQNQGRGLYLSYGCALCHGKEGHGDGINAQKFNPPPADFTNAKDYRHGMDTDSIRRSIQYGIKEDNSIMPAFEDIPSQEMDEIINYLKSLQKKGTL